MEKIILRFKFEAPTNQGIIEKICIRVADELGIKLGLSRDLENIYAYIEATEEEIERFSKRLSEDLPLSIFLRSLSADVVEEFKDDLNREFPDISLPPCPKCLREFKDENSSNYLNICHHCEVCGYKVNKKLKIESEKLKELVEKLNVENITIQTMNGVFEISKNIEDAEIIVAKDLASVAKYFMSFEGDAKALASIEKPMVKLKTNLEFKKTFGISTPAFNVKLPDDLILEALFMLGDFELLGLKKADIGKDLSFEVEIEKIPFAVVTDSERKDILLYEGDRGIIPAFEKFVKEGIVGRYKDYISFSENNKSIIKHGNDGKEAKAPYAGFFGVLNQWNLEEKSIAGFCFYKKDESKVFINNPKFGLIEYVDFKFKFKDVEEVFGLIRSMNETGKKLISNFAKRDIEIFEKVLKTKLDSDFHGIYYLWGVIGCVLGFADNVEESAKKLLMYSNEVMAKKGPRIDYKVENNALNPLWPIRTAISFHLAGVDNYLLSYGVIESFAEFLSNLYDGIDKDIPLDGAVIVGDLLEGEFLNKIYSYITKNHKVYTPRGLPISGAVEAYGSLVVNSKTT
ncbi:hypothetical protein [Caminibacter sp.]